MKKWLNYDLHMHSNASKPFDGERVKSMSAHDFIQTLINEKIDVFSITDHNVFDSKYYLEILNEISENNLNIQVIFGAELNVYLDENKDDYFHMGAYFESKKERIHEIDEIIRDLYKDNKKPTLFKILNTFNEKHFKTIIIPEFDKSRGLTTVSQSLVESDMMDSFRHFEMQRIFDAYDRGVHFKEAEVQEWAIAFYRRTKEFSTYLNSLNDEQKKSFILLLKQYLAADSNSVGFGPEIIKYGDIIKAYSLEFAFFHFSDWHNAEIYSPEYNNFIFGDFDYPFSALEIAVCDPYSRIRVTKHSEFVKTDINALTKLSFQMDGQTIDIPLTEGLNAIIGQRASGKSLLVNVLLQLKDSTDKGLLKYDQLKINRSSIMAEKINGTTISLGQLSSVTYLKQSSISKLYEDPNSAEETFTDKFPILPDTRINELDYIFNNIDKLKPFNKNYKEFNTYCTQLFNFKKFSFKTIKRIETSEFESKSILLISEFKKYAESLKNIGFSLSHLANLKKSIYETDNTYKLLVSFYNQIIDKINEIIDKYVKESSDDESIMSQIKKNYNDSLDIIKSNFENLLLYKRIEKKINDLDNLEILPGKRNSFEDFLFVSEYSATGDDIKARVALAIEDVLKPSVPRERCSKNLIEYLYGKVIYSKDNQTFSTGLKKEFASSSLEINRTLFRIKNPNLYDENLPIDDLINNGCLADITHSSPGDRAAAYLEILMSNFDSILILDQPEDDIDNHYISTILVPLIRKKKRSKQLIFVTHNPSVAVYADAFNYIFAKNDGNKPVYDIRSIEKPDDKEKILDILDGGRHSFYSRNIKYGDVIGEFEHDN